MSETPDGTLVLPRGHGEHGEGRRQMREKLVDCDEEPIDRVLTAATDVHRGLGPGMLEKVYQAALMIEFEEAGIRAQSEVAIDATYRGHNLGLGFRADIVVEGCLLLELKATSKLADAHTATMISYLRQLGIRRGYILNFHAPLMKHGIKRISI